MRAEITRRSVRGETAVGRQFLVSVRLPEVVVDQLEDIVDRENAGIDRRDYLGRTSRNQVVLRAVRDYIAARAAKGR